MKSDDIYSKPLGQVVDFKFDDSVVNVFPDMIQRSVPGYSTIVAMIGMLAQRHLTENTQAFDLGCSLGAAALSMAKGCKDINQVNIIAVDNSAAMIKRCTELLIKDPLSRNISLQQQDIQQTSVNNAAMVVLNFTLQFIAIEQRQALLDKIYQGMNPGGVLVLSEKLKFDNQTMAQEFVEMHHAYKAANGYSSMEIAQKRNALENVLLPETLTAHKTRLQNAGFNSIEVWFQCFNFCSILAIKC